jgi:hypothetical protein
MRALPLLLFPAIALVGSHLTRTTAWVGTFDLTIVIGLCVASLLTAIAVIGRFRSLSIFVVAGLLVANTAFMLGRISGMRLGVLPPPDPRFAILLSAGTLIGVGGLIARRQWARWLCLALGAAALGCGLLNGINFWSVSGGTPNTIYFDWYCDMCRAENLYLVTALGGVVIVMNLVAARDVFESNATWADNTPVVRWLRASMIASFVAVPMLLIYAWMQPLAPQTATTAIVLAAALTTGAVLGVRGKLIGALLLVLAGLGLAAQTIATVLLAHDMRIAIYYVAFWAPAALVALVTGCLLVGPTVRLLRRLPG